MLARKFRKDFKHAVIMVNERLSKLLKLNEEIKISEIMDCPLKFESLSKILFYLGFSKTNQNTEETLITSLWGILSNEAEFYTVKAQSFYHFLCYLQSFETVVEVPK
jgi:hypothetical protein